MQLLVVTNCYFQQIMKDVSFMTKSKLPKSVRKYIRREKAKIRRVFADPKEVENKIKELMTKFNSRSKIKDL